MRKHNLPEISYLRNLLRYEPDTGKLFWKKRTDVNKTWNTRFAGKEAGHVCNSNKYRVMRINGRTHQCARVAYAIHHGKWPDPTVDHINGNHTDNRIANLREASPSQQARNQPQSSRNKSGVTGVHWSSANNNWIAQIRIDGRGYHLGSFNCTTAAMLARKRAEIKHKFHENHGRQS